MSNESMRGFTELLEMAPGTDLGSSDWYRVTQEDINTFGVGATFVTSAAISDDVVYIVAKSVMENIEDFRKLHPAFKHLDPKQMVSDGLSAPLHPGAEKAYMELGLK